MNFSFDLFKFRFPSVEHMNIITRLIETDMARRAMKNVFKVRIYGTHDASSVAPRKPR
jgi:hypothetical protein